MLTFFGDSVIFIAYRKAVIKTDGRTVFPREGSPPAEKFPVKRVRYSLWSRRTNPERQVVRAVFRALSGQRGGILFREHRWYSANGAL